MRSHNVALTAALTALALVACSRAEPAPSPAAPPPAVAAAQVASAAQAAPAAQTAEEKVFEVALVPPAEARAGQPATARVIITARGTFHVNREYPMAFRPEPGSTAAFGAEKIPLGERAERTPCAAHPEEACSVSAPLPFTLAAAGPATLAGTVAFSVCNADLCRIEKTPLTMAVLAR